MTSSTAEYPRDADGDALRRVAGEGADLARPMVIEFTVDAPDEAVASAVAERVSIRGYIASIYHDDEDGSITVCCAKSMLATYHGVVDAQAEINALCTPLGAHCDGWGTWGNHQGR